MILTTPVEAKAAMVKSMALPLVLLVIMQVGSYISGLESVQSVCRRLGQAEFLKQHGEPEDFEDEGQDEDGDELELIAVARLEHLYDQASSLRAELK